MDRSYIKQLFSRKSFRDKAEEIKGSIKREIRSVGRELITGDDEHLAIGLFDKYKFHKATLKGHEVKVNGDTVEYIISFNGSDGTFFDYSPDKTTFDPPQANVLANGMSMYYSLASGSEAVKSEFNRDYENLKKWVGELSDDIDEFNDGLGSFIDKAISKQKAEFKREMELEDELNP